MSINTFMSVNTKLEELYSKNLSVIQEISTSADVPIGDEVYSKWDGPLLMYCWDEQYQNAKRKILFVGQEHSRSDWGFANDDIKHPIESYKKFELGKKYSSPFWIAIRQLNKILNPDQPNEPNFLWTNVSKYSTDGGKSLTEADHNFIVKKLDLLTKEIQIANPDIVIFFSGPGYDSRIISQFDETLEFEELATGIPVRELARVKHSLLPYNSYRTYHPYGLQFQQKWSYIQLIADSILKS